MSESAPQHHLHAKLHLSSYKGSHLKTRIYKSFIVSPGQTAWNTIFEGAVWDMTVRVQAVPQKPEAFDLFISAVVSDGNANEVAFGLELEKSTWTREHFLVLPGAVYDGNRFTCKPEAGYPPIAAQTGDTGPNPPITIGDIPRLSTTSDRSQIRLLSADMATPSIGFFNPHNNSSVWVLTPQATCLGQSGIDFEEDLEKCHGTIRVTAPGLRERTRYHCFRTDRPSIDRAANWQTREAAILQVRILGFSCASRLEFINQFSQIRKTLARPSPPRSTFTLSSAKDLIEEKYNSENWNEESGFYSTVTRSNDSWPEWQPGWIGGGMAEYVFQHSQSEVSRKRAARSVDYICANAMTPSGFFKGLLSRGKWKDDSFEHSKPPSKWHMTRKSADLLLFLAKQMEASEKPPKSWTSAARGCADAFLRLWAKEQQIGQFVDENTGELILGGSESAAILPAALSRLGRILKEPRYSAAAIAIADSYWLRFQEQGFTTGGPGEILSAPDSESAFGLLESFVALMEDTLDSIWVARAEAAANYCATWCVSYDFAFPIASTLGSLQTSSTGTVIASAQNKHSSPGICTLSGDSLFRLFRATGNRTYLELLREIATALPQFVSRLDRPIVAKQNGKINPPGWICERVNMSDWLEPVGEVFHGSCWCEISLLLSAIELPSVYFQPDTGLLVSLDNIECTLLGKNAGAWVLALTNHSDFPAIVKIYSEYSQTCSVPLPLLATAGLESIAIPPRSCCTHRVYFNSV